MEEFKEANIDFVNIFIWNSSKKQTWTHGIVQRNKYGHMEQSKVTNIDVTQKQIWNG